MTYQEVMQKYEVVIGIETHVQLATKSKLFCACDNDSRDAEPNTHICPVCLGLPGTLPVLNEEAVRLAIRTGLALNGQIAERTKFDRNNYFYPDLPKGYQITQFDQPIVGKRGHLDIIVDGQPRSRSASHCAFIWKATPVSCVHTESVPTTVCSTSTGPKHPCSRSSRSPICAAPPRPRPTPSNSI